MNICKSDIYFIITLCLFIYLYLNLNKKNEGFQTTDTGYKGDIEAIRNLSSIATKLTNDNNLTMPGVLNVTNNLNIGDPNCPSGGNNPIGVPSLKMLTLDNTYNPTAGQGIPANKIRLHNNGNNYIAGFGLEDGGQSYHSWANHKFYVNSGQKYGDLAFHIDGAKNASFKNDLYINSNLILDGDNKWILHTPDDGRKNLIIAPWNGKNDWDWGKSLNINNDGSLSIPGNLMLNTFYRKYMIAGMYTIRDYSRSTYLNYGWTILYEDNNTLYLTQRLSLYEKKSNRNGFVNQSPKPMTINNCQPYRFVLFPGYCARFYYWGSKSSDECKFNSGYYEWIDKSFTTKTTESVCLIHVTLDSEGISNFDDLTCDNLHINTWKTDIFPPW